MSRSIFSYMLSIDKRKIISVSPAFRREYASSTKKPTKSTTEKAKKSRSKVHMLQIENAMLFGKLLETSKERAKALKLTSAKVRKATASLANTNDGTSIEANIVKIEVRGAELVEKPVKIRKPKSDKPTKLAKTVSSERRGEKKLTHTKKEPSTSHAFQDQSIQNPVPANEEKIPWTPIKLPEGKPLTVPHPIDPSAPKLPSVTKILSASMSPEQRAILDRWEKNKIKELGEVGFRRYKQELFLVGREFHANVEEILRGTPEDILNIRDPIKPLWTSIRHILSSVQEVQVLESFVSHPELGYCGVVDCIATFRDRVVLIDWKTSEKSKPVVTMTYDTPLQIAAYIGAINADPKYNLEIKEGLIVMGYKTGQISDTYWLTENDIENYWNQWTKRLELFQAQSQGLHPPVDLGIDVGTAESETSSAK